MRKQRMKVTISNENDRTFRIMVLIATLFNVTMPTSEDPFSIRQLHLITIIS